MRQRRARWSVLAGLVVAGTSAVAHAQTTLNGVDLVLKSANSTTLNANGYVGTYLVVPVGGATVNFTVNASAATGAGADPHMNLVIADAVSGFAVNSTSAVNYTTSNVTLPAGTYFVRNERDYAGNAGVSRSFTVNNLSVHTISGSAATFTNVNTNTTALAAADTYINNYRKGTTTMTLRGPGNLPLLAGTPVHVDLARHAFNFGGTVSGSSLNDSKDMLAANPAPGSEQEKFQKFINKNFNTIVPSNGGKWGNNEAGNTQPAAPNMTLVDKQLNYAQQRNLRARMHNLIWGSGATSGSQQPVWVNNLITAAAGGNAAAKTSLSNAITNRINYYVGTNGNRSLKYVEIDGLNEAHHNPSYWNIYSTAGAPDGIANIYNQVAAAAAAAGAQVRIYTNEFNVIQYSPATISSTGVESGSDQYANWYRNQVEAIRNAGGAVTGIGVQEYANVTQTGSNAHSAATMQKALQNLSVEGLPISMAEFGLAGGTTKANSQSLGPAAMEDTMRMFFGAPNATTFMMWGWWDLTGAAYPPAAMLDNTSGTGNNAVLSPMGTRWEWLFNGNVTDPLKGGTNANAWDTDFTATLDATGQITFNGFYGDYYLGGQNPNALNAKVLPFDVTHEKGVGAVAATLAKPPDWFFWKTNASSTWSAPGNWTDAPESGGLPNAAGRTAYFGASATSRNLTTGAATTVNITAPVTVTISSAVTAGMLVFDNANGYTLSATGGGAISLAGYDNAAGNVAAVYVVNGNHAVNAPLTLLDDTTVTVAPPASTLTFANLQQSAASLTKSGGGTLAVNNVRAAALNVIGGTLKVLPNGTNAGASNVGGLSINPAATLDLTNNSLMTSAPIGTWDGVAYTGVTGMIQFGRIMTSESDAQTGLTALGIAASGGDTLVLYTYAGDANLDGKINVDDYGQIDSNVSKSGSVFGWFNGDFNYDGKINIDDYGIIDSNINRQGAPLEAAATPLGGVAAAVPEPASLTLLCGGAVLVACRRRRC